MPGVSRELIKSMLMDDRDSLPSDEDYSQFYENEIAMMLESGRFDMDRLGMNQRGGRGKKKKKLSEY